MGDMSNDDSTKMVSLFQMETFSVVRHFKIVGYSLIKEYRSDTKIEVGKFDLAGHTWALCYCQQSLGYPTTKEYVALGLMLMTPTKVPIVISSELSFLNQDGKSSPAATKTLRATFTENGTFSFTSFMTIAEMDAAEYLKNDSFTLKLSLQVKKPMRIEETNKKNVEVPPSDLNQQLSWLLETGEGADVTFRLNEETYVAHKNILAARSPVFRAQFFGSMVESKADSVTVEEMRPEVFKALLYYIYTDALPPQLDVSIEMSQHLLVAADRYGLERLKLICTELLCAGIDADTAATSLALAVRHNCAPLKDFCVDFIASREMLDAVMATDEFERLMASCPLVMKEILEKVHSSRRF